MTQRKPTLLFYCQHSLGMGHFVRSVALAERLSDACHVLFCNGGPLPDGVPFPSAVERIDLAPLGMRDDGLLVSLTESLDVETALARRRDTLIELLRVRRPRLLLVELFPFGRRKFEPELLPLLDAAHELGEARPRVVCSVRDLLVTARRSQQGFDDHARTLCDRYFDLILVHADRTFAALEESFRPTQPLRVPVCYTGFLARAQSCGRHETRHGLIVSAGGGMVGEPLFRAAVEAHKHNWAVTSMPTTIVTGPFAPASVVTDLIADAERIPGLDVVPHVPDLGEWFARARASVSQCGYNTMLDVVRSRVPALVVPFAEGRENEQTRRAERLAGLGMVRWLSPLELTTTRLAHEILRLFEFEPAPMPFSLDGAAVSARVLAAEVAETEVAHARG